ncbi:iron chaperone [Isoptericola aurantiacus]|uniref:iron chaperone n=1 Tax=Isoptericola aurantiacus TaxID=3377839 RepID=UPI00383B00E0
MDEVSEYVASLDEPARTAVGAIVERARTIVPDAVEGTSYGMPALRYRDSPLISAVLTKKHVGVYPFSPPVVEALAGELDGFRVTKGSIGFAPDRPLPDDVVDRLVTLRRDEIDAMRAR